MRIASLVAGVLLLLVVNVQPVQADGGPLESEVAQYTGIQRLSSAYLRQVATVRSAEIVSNFAHRPMPELAAYSWGEIIAYNRGYADPVGQAVIQWNASPSHRTIMFNPAYTQIGCDHRVTADNKHWFVCLFIVAPVQGPQLPQPPQSPPVVDEIPDTAMEASMLSRIVLAVVVAVVVGLVCILLGQVLASLGVPIAVTIGGFLAQWGWVLGILAGLWYFFRGGFSLPQ